MGWGTRLVWTHTNLTKTHNQKWARRGNLTSTHLQSNPQKVRQTGCQSNAKDRRLSLLEQRCLHFDILLNIVVSGSVFNRWRWWPGEQWRAGWAWPQWGQPSGGLAWPGKQLIRFRKTVNAESEKIKMRTRSCDIDERATSVRAVARVSCLAWVRAVIKSSLDAVWIFSSPLLVIYFQLF